MPMGLLRMEAPVLESSGSDCPACIGPGALPTQPRPDRNGMLRVNYQCACSASPLPPGEGSQGVDDEFLCRGWIAVAC